MVKSSNFRLTLQARSAAGYREGFEVPEYPEREDCQLFLEHWKRVLLTGPEDEDRGGSIVNVRWWYEGVMPRSFPGNVQHNIPHHSIDRSFAIQSIILTYWYQSLCRDCY